MKAVPLKRFCREVDTRAGREEKPLLSVSIHRGVVPRNELTDDLPRADDLSNYKVCDAGDIVLNRMRAFQGAIGVSQQSGIVSPDYMVLRPSAKALSAYLHYAFRSEWFVGEMTSRIRGIGSVDLGSVRTPRINASDLLDIEMRLPCVDEQRRIADFLDDQSARIDNIVAARRHQVELLAAWLTCRLTEIVFSGHARNVPASLLADVRLGRQRSPRNVSGDHMCRYLRSANVTDGAVNLEDVLEMNFDPVEQQLFGLRSGDVLVTEGAGSPEALGAAALWNGSEEGLCFQNTLIRLRPRAGDLMPEYLAWWARTSHRSGAMRVWATGANILHLGAEGAKRMPIPARTMVDQREVVRECDRAESQADSLRRSAQTAIARLGELKRSLITAAVTGEFDVSSADGSRVPA
jgi:type I restriction enzyme S subunit